MKSAIKIFVTLGIVVAIIWYLGGIDNIIKHLISSSPVWICIAFLIATLDRILMSFKWGLLLKSRGIEIPLFYNVKIYCSTMIWGMFLPSTVGADAIRAYIVSRTTGGTNEIVASIVVERMIGFLSSIILGLSGLFILNINKQIDNRFDPIWWLGSAVLSGAAVLFILSFSRTLFDKIYNLFPTKLRKTKIINRIESLHNTYLSYKASIKSVLVFFILTISEQLLTIIYIWSTAFAVNVDISLVFMIGVVPLTLLISRLPISIDGIGVFEGVFILLMALGDVSATEAVAIALIGRIIQTFAWIPWWASYSLQYRSLKPPMAQDSIKKSGY